MKKGIKTVLTALTLCVFLSGCQIIGFDTQNLMHPPKATGDKAEIQNVLLQETGGNITLKYPQRGDYRSAIVMFDITGNGEEEAIVFYRLNDEVATDTNMMIIARKDGKWRKVGNFTNSGTEIDRVCFGDMDGDGQNEIIVGWATHESTANALSVFKYTQKEVLELPLKYTYTEMIVDDFDGDQNQEIFLASLALSAGNKPSNARLLKMDSDGKSIANQGYVELYPNVTKYAAVTAGRISEDQYGVVIDGSKPGDMLVTELVYWDKSRKMLMAPAYDASKQKVRFLAERSSTTISKDINNDSIIEIPTVSPMLGYSENDKNQVVYLTRWWRYNPQKEDIDPVWNMVANYTDGYSFILPDTWENRVTAKMDTKNRTLIFYEWKRNTNGTGELGDELLRIQIFSSKEWEEGKNTNDYSVILKQSSKIYAYTVKTPKNPLALDYDAICNCFRLINIS